MELNQAPIIAAQAQGKSINTLAQERCRRASHLEAPSKQ